MTIEIAETASTAIDSDRWPDVARVPRGRVSAVIADRLIRRAAARLPLRLAYPDGTVVGAADPTLPTMVIHRPDEFARRLGRYGLIGFGESYMAGEWSCDDLVGLINEFAKSVAELIPPALQRLRSAGGGAPAALSAPKPSAGAPQHRRALRPVQRPVRRVPRRNDDVLERAVRHVARLPGRPARRAATQDRPPAGHGARRSRQPGVGDRHGLGRTVPARRGAGRTRPLDHAVG